MRVANPQTELGAPQKNKLVLKPHLTQKIRMTHFTPLSMVNDHYDDGKMSHWTFSDTDQSHKPKINPNYYYFIYFWVIYNQVK